MPEFLFLSCALFVFHESFCLLCFLYVFKLFPGCVNSSIQCIQTQWVDSPFHFLKNSLSNSSLLSSSFLLLFFFFFFFATPTACGSSQARDQICTTAVATQILNPLSHQGTAQWVCVCVFSGLFRVAPATYGGSQARGRIGATATGLYHSHSNAGSELCLWPTQRWILNPLSKARDRTRNLMVPSRICFRCTTTGTPPLYILLYGPTSLQF